MAKVHTEIQFMGLDVLYQSYILADGNIYISDDINKQMDCSNNSVIINKDEWNDFKNFIDRQILELEK